MDNMKVRSFSWLMAPDGWEVRPARTAFVERKLKSNDGSEDLLSVSQYTGVRRRAEMLDASETRLTRAASLVGYKLAFRGDLVVNTMLAWNGSMGIAPCDGIVSPSYAVYEPLSSSDSRFNAYLLTTPAYKGAIRSWSTGIQDSRLRIYPGTFLSLPLLQPPLETQRLIVRYLDDFELRIAKAIAGKNDLLIKMLEMRRAIVAARILGTNASVRVSDELPFEVPSTWSNEPFWAVAPEISVSGHSEKELLSVYLDRGVIRYSESAGHVHKPSLDLSKYQLVQPHDLVLNNQQAWRGSVGVSQYEGIVSPAYVVCRLDNRFDTDFANMLFRSPVMVSQFEMASRGVGSIQRQLHRPSLRVIRVPIPSLAEQVRIASQLMAETKGIDAALLSLREEIALLKEYRIRLISDVVTGKIDILEEAMSLPEIDTAELAEVLAGELREADDVEGSTDGDN